LAYSKGQEAIARKEGMVTDEDILTGDIDHLARDYEALLAVGSDPVAAAAIQRRLHVDVASWAGESWEQVRSDAVICRLVTVRGDEVARGIDSSETAAKILALRSLLEAERSGQH
jgi:hypothetical protein